MSTNEDAVLIVSGLPRSGTSMMMRMLEFGGLPVLIDEIRTPNEDNPNGYYEFEAVKQTRQDASWLGNAAGKVVKMVYRLLYDLPRGYDYKVIFMRRNTDEVLASQKKMLERNGDAGINDISSAQISALFRRQLKEFKEWIEGQSNFSILEVDYNRTLEEPEAELERLNAFLGGRLDTRAMVEVVDQTLYRNRVAR